MGKPGADRRDHGLLHQMHFTGFRAIGRIHYSAFFHLRDFAGNPDHDARMNQHFAAVRLLNEVIQHLLSDLEIGDHAVFHRLDGDDIAGRAAQHFLGFLADGLDFPGVLVDGDDGWFVDYNALAFSEDERIRRPKVDGKIRRKKTKKRA